MQNNQLTEFNEGGTHGQNPLGGIPIGQAASVEQGESMKGDFVYSDRIPINEDVVKEFNLPNYIKNKTAAEASKLINNKFKDRLDKYTNETKTTLLDRLAEAQEAIKAKEQALAESIQSNQQEVPDQMNGEIPEGMEEFVQPNQMFLGGMIKEEGGLTQLGQQSALGGLSMLGSAVSGGGVKDVLKSGVSSAANMLIPGSGAVVGGIVDGVSKMFSKSNREADRARAFTQTSGVTNDFALGGPLKPWEQPSSLLEEDPNYVNPLFKPINTIPQVGASTLIRPIATSLSGQIKPAGLVSYKNELPSSNLYGTKTIPTEVENKDSWLDRNGDKILKYAPIGMNAYQLAKLKRPENKALDRINQRYTPEYVDEKSLQNIVGNEMTNTINSISQLGGSEGATRASILGAELNKTKGLGDMYMNAAAQNRATNDVAQKFNLGVNQFNAQTQAQESQNWEQNSANYRNQKSKLLGAIGTDLGQVGKEEVNKNQIAEALGYTWDGKYVTDKKTGRKITFEQLIAQRPEASTEVKAYGGYLKMNKIGRK